MPTVRFGRARLFLAKFAILGGLKWQKTPLTLEMANSAIVVGIFCVEGYLPKHDGFFDSVFPAGEGRGHEKGGI